MPRILAIQRYWKKAPPVNELVVRFFEEDADDAARFDALVAQGEIKA